MDVLTFEALGGTCEIFALSPREPLAATEEWIHALHGRLTRFDPHSELSEFNARAGEWTAVSPELRDLLEAGLTAFEESDGLVNIAILPDLMRAGYDRTWEELAPCSEDGPALPTRRVPPLPAVLEVAGRSGLARLVPGAAIDLGGLAKGWIADRAVERLGDNALVSCAGDLYARGTGESGDGWPVGFGEKTLLLRDMGAATSGTTKRRWGEGLHHLIDPRTGRPAESDLQEVSVLAPTALAAEIYAKTALLLGSAAAPSYLEDRSNGWNLV
ncbi:MAG: FAD:protein FMN transferase [Chloroflexota bacterium]|nr:FAD:protein FMN transferase [Chloroflexota bacterium]